MDKGCLYRKPYGNQFPPQWIAFTKYSYSQLKWAVMEKPTIRDAYVTGKIYEEKGILVEELGAWLSEKRDTRVYTLNLCEMEKSMHFNPFLYIRSKSDVTKLVTNLIQNTNSPNIKNSSADPFWESATCS